MTAEELWAALEATALATHLRGSRWTYPLVNAGHILGIALLVGSVVPLDLRLLGLWRSIPRETVERLLVPVAAAGLAVAATTGVLLFLVQARDYAALGLFQAKLALIGLATLNALAAVGLRRRGGSDRVMVGLAAVSLLCWPAALVAGRMLGYVL